MGRSKGKTLLFLSLILLVSSADAAPDPARHYRAIRVVDGDTFDATDGVIRFRVRIAGMDAPEQGTPFSGLATVTLKKRIEGKDVEIKPLERGMDPYNRILGQVTVDGRDIAIEMIERGLATYYRPGCVDYPANKKFYDYDPHPYLAAENKARAKRLYLWSKSTILLPCAVRLDLQK